MGALSSKIFIFIAGLFFLPVSLYGGRLEKTIGANLGMRDYQKKWSHLFESESENFKAIIELMSSTSTGEKIFLAATKKAAQEGKTLLEVLHSGPGSLTDTTLLRKFSASDPLNVSFEQRSVVTINQDLTVLDATLDLAHELIHFIYRRPFNPYADLQDPLIFITSTIEGRGGEVDAFIGECKVLSELVGTKSSPRFHCHHIQDSEGKISRDLTIKYFYRAGMDDYNELVKNMGISSDGDERTGVPGLPLLSAVEPIFISSAYGHSYPLAAWKEFHLVKERACENEKRRLEFIKFNHRGPAALEAKKVIDNYNKSCLPLGEATENRSLQFKQSSIKNLNTGS